MRTGGLRAVAAALGIALALAVGEVALRAIGFGDPILYDNRVAYGYRPLPNQARRRFKGVRVHVNALGVRGPDITAVRPPGTMRILFLGDSVTWGGSYVDDEALFAAIAARRLGHAEWLDAGVNGWGPENVLGLVRETRGFDSSVWVVVGLEDDLRREKTHVGEMPYFMTPPRTAIEELLVLGAYRLLGRYKQEKPAADLERLAATNLGHYGAILDEAHTAGARALLVWHPTADALARNDDPHRAPFLALAAAHGASSLDLTPAYQAAGGAVYVDGMHLDTEGHRIAGEAIAGALAAWTR